MTDLSRVLAHFPVGQFARLMPVLEKHDISTCDLLTLEAADIGKRTRLPLLDIRRLTAAVLDALHTDLGVSEGTSEPAESRGLTPGPPLPARPGAGLGPVHTTNHHQPALKNTAASLTTQWRTISTLDPELDHALAGGIPVGSITEITGESGSGKTQFLLTLLLSVQLPPPHGLGRPALYLSTEAPLSTRRLAQMLASNPFFKSLPPRNRPSLDNVLSTVTPDLESQDHIINFQVPVEVERRRIGLIVLDSVAANYRAEFDRGGPNGSRHGSNMGARAAELLKLGMHLRDLAQRHNLAVVVSNQVSDRISGDNLALPGPSLVVPTPTSSLRRPPLPPGHPPRQTQESPLASRTRPPSLNPDGDPNPDGPHSAADPDPDPVPAALSSAPQPPPSSTNAQPPAPFFPTHLLLDHQQRWFTGWGDDPPPSSSSMKTPSLGLVWTTQLGARIVLGT
ncbi:hypothetical protein VTJ49DRAFT_604 [Mycothermus thermophilus]|uniref:RecA family profile 1 domain-containing protein n=1 Tax=Humicola insolens TaxID=85995 RepID=A0ABR3VPC7_HUMIN